MSQVQLANTGARKSVWVVAVVLLLLLVPMPSFAQATGTILGVVKDTSGGVVPQAKVTIINADTNESRTQTTGDDGSFRFPALVTGHYTVRIEKEGFQTQTQTGLTLEVTQELVVNPALQVGASTQEVTVTGEAPLVNTTNSSLGGLVNEQKIADLPLNGRNYTDLTFMQPGVAVATNTGNSGAQGGVRGEFFSSDGAPIRSNMTTLDGAILTNGRGGTTSSESGTTLGVAGIKEYKVVSGVFGAEYGIAPAAQVVMVSKGGTNQFHGEGFEYIRNDVLDAANFFDKPTEANGFKRLPPFRRNNFGGSFGGPIRKDKTFFFAAYEGLRQRLGQTLLDTVPAAGCHGTGHAGDVIWNGQAPQPVSFQGICPQLGTNPNGSGTNTVTIAPVMVQILTLYPVPNLLPLSQNLFTTPSTSPSQVDWGQIRVDQNISASDTLFGRYSTDKSFLISATTVTAGASGVGFPELFNASYASYDQFTTIGENHIFSPTVLNSTRFSYSRTNWGEDNIYTTGAASVTGPGFSYVAGLPWGATTITGFSGNGPGANNPQGGITNIYTLNDDLFWSKGKHALKFGTQVNRWNTGVFTSKSLNGGPSFSSLGNFLQGLSKSWSALQNGANAVRGRNWMYWVPGFYIQDDWRILPRLTLNLGLRYEFMTEPYETDGKEWALRNVNTDMAMTQGPPFLPFSKLHFTPRVGFAWDVQGNGKLSVRGGVGEYYDIGNLNSQFLGGKQAEPPLNGLLTHSSSVATTITLPLTFCTPSCPSGQADAIGIQTTNYNFLNPYFWKWNLTVERQLPFGMGLQVAYVGTRGTHLYQSTDGNQYLPTAIINGFPWFDGTETRINPNFSTNQFTTTAGWSAYHGLQVALNRRLANGLQFQTSYTYSHGLDNSQSSFGGVDCNGAAGMNSKLYYGPGNEGFAKGPSCSDARHNLRLNVLYHVPDIKSNNFAAKAEHGWWMGTIFSAQTGYPFTPGDSSGRNVVAPGGSLTLATAADAAACPAVSLPTCAYVPIPFNSQTVIKGTVNQWYNPNMFVPLPVYTTAGGPTLCTTATCTATLNNFGYSTIGYIQRGLLRGPGLLNLDLSINKDTRVPFLGESGMVQFRAEFFNIMNHPIFAMPNGTVVSPNSSAFSSYVTAPNSSAGAITQTIATSRQIQFALKLVF